MSQASVAPSPCLVIVLAAGQGTRMHSARAKVLHTLCGRPMIQFVMDAALGLAPEAVIVVVGHEAEAVKEALRDTPALFAFQREQKGTGHAAAQAMDLLEGHEGDIVLFYGDTPLIDPGELSRLRLERARTGADLALLVTTLASPAGYGRIVRRDSEVQRIVEERDATSEEKAITEINPGIYCFTAAALRFALPRLDNRNRQGEYYLTDAVSLLKEAGRKVVAISSPSAEHLLGINTRQELARAETQMRRRKAEALMLQGVTLVDPDRFYPSWQTTVGPGSTIYPNVVLEGDVRVGSDATLFPNSRIVNSTVGDGARIMDGCLIVDSEVGAGTVVGPFAHLRAHARVGADCRIGNFVEVKNSVLGDESKAAHLTYLGDAVLGRDVNVGAGTITCNYDGVSKNRTTIGDEAFIGSGTELIAPVTIGERSYIAAGSTISEDVPPDSLGIARARQTNKEGWAKERKATAKKGSKPRA